MTGALGLTAAQRAEAGRRLCAFLDGYARSSATGPIVPAVDRDALAGLLATSFPEAGIGVDGLFREIETTLPANSTAVAHPRFLAYVLGPPNGIAPYAEAVAAALNQNCNFSQLSPAASVIERTVIAWLAQLFGFPDGAGGLLTDGGSMATLTAIAAAANDRAPDFRAAGLQSRRGPLTLYTSAEAHASVEKAAAILGLGLANVRKVPTDARQRLRIDLLRRAIRDDRQADRQPFCVVATAGTVTTGAIDPIDEIADLCAEEGLWLHVDGAYGALFVLSERFRERLSPCSRADSISLDPHKLLFAPLEAGGLLARDRETLRRTFAFESSYLTAATIR
jgi:aromatic-L-amino-acid decarboxylase